MKLLLGSLFSLTSIFFTPVYGAELCTKYLSSPSFSLIRQSNSSDLLNDTTHRFILIQESLYKKQGNLIVLLRQLLKERAFAQIISVNSQSNQAVPSLKPNTLNLLSEWHTTVQGGSDQYLLEDLISQDPYIKWLIKNWTDNRPALLKTNTGDFSDIVRVDGLSEPKPDVAPTDVFGYLNQHLRYIGPMSLSTELTIFRIMRDHDPQLTPEMSALLNRIFEYNRFFYVLHNQIIKLNYNGYGSAEDWDEFTDLKSVMLEFRNLKSQIRLMFPNYSELEFNKLQKKNKQSEALSFEEYILTDYLKRSEQGLTTSSNLGASENVAISSQNILVRNEILKMYSRYKLVKGILHNLSLSLDEELLIQDLEPQVESLWSYFLY